MSEALCGGMMAAQIWIDILSRTSFILNGIELWVSPSRPKMLILERATRNVLFSSSASSRLTVTRVRCVWLENYLASDHPFPFMLTIHLHSR